PSSVVPAVAADAVKLIADGKLAIDEASAAKRIERQFDKKARNHFAQGFRIRPFGQKEPPQHEMTTEQPQPRAAAIERVRRCLPGLFPQLGHLEQRPTYAPRGRLLDVLRLARPDLIESVFRRVEFRQARAKVLTSGGVKPRQQSSQF